MNKDLIPLWLLPYLEQLRAEEATREEEAQQQEWLYINEERPRDKKED